MKRKGKPGAEAGGLLFLRIAAVYLRVSVNLLRSSRFHARRRVADETAKRGGKTAAVTPSCGRAWIRCRRRPPPIACGGGAPFPGRKTGGIGFFRSRRMLYGSWNAESVPVSLPTKSVLPSTASRVGRAGTLHCAKIFPEAFTR